MRNLQRHPADRFCLHVVRGFDVTADPLAALLAATPPADGTLFGHEPAPPPPKTRNYSDTPVTNAGQAIAVLKAAGLDAEVISDAVEATPPPSTVNYVRELLHCYDASRPRSMQTALGPSEIGHPCPRNIALKLVGAPEAPRELAWAPLQGVAMHATMEDALRYDNERAMAATPSQLDVNRGPIWIIEGDVEVDDNIRGHSDAYHIPTGCVVDWKYAGKTAIGKLLSALRRGDPPAKQISTEYRVQAHLYGYAMARKGHDVRWVRIVFLARDYDYNRSAEWTESYRPDVAEWALKRYYDIARAANDWDYRADLEAIVAKPGPDACKWCPFAGGVCPGDVGANDRARSRFADGLI